MATAKTANPETVVSTAPDPWERVTVRLPRVTGKDEYVYVSVNDYTALIKRGENVSVPRCAAEHLMLSEHAEDVFQGTVDRLLEQAEIKP